MDSEYNIRPRIAFVLKGYPRLSETFIAQEIHMLETLGLDIHIVSLRFPIDKAIHPTHKLIKAPILYLPEYLKDAPLRLLKAWLYCRKLSSYQKLKKIFWKDFKRDLSMNRIRRFGQAFVLTKEMPYNCYKIHAHFVHTPGSVARYASILLELPYSLSAHAKDIYTIQPWEVAEKLADSLWLTTCTRYNKDFLQNLSAKYDISEDKVFLNYHGINLETFHFNKHQKSNNNSTLTLISVGRAVQKKGYQYLLKALALIDGKTVNDWQFVHIGGGELLTELQNLSKELNIDSKVKWLGSQPQKFVLEQLKNADIFVLLSVITKSGDRDGLPNVLMEAQSQALPVLTTEISGIPELIEDNVNGLFVDHENLQSIADALIRLIDDKELRLRLGGNGKQKVYREFSHVLNIQPLYQRHLDDYQHITKKL